ncbi:MAG: J domain-containing protein [Alphaproteobacteria bacterium]|nr:J domain-containing protein [Alphaproteobacteria bacterium]
MRDPYDVLGVKPSASPSEIKAASRKPAKKFHPDVNADDPAVEGKFKEINTAYNLVSDPDRRAKYDRGDLDAEGNERRFSRGGYRGARQGPRSSAGGTAGGGTSRGPFGGGGSEDIFAEFFRAAGMRPDRNAQSGGDSGTQTQSRDSHRGADVTYKLDVDFLEATAGAKKRVTFPDGKSLDVAIPGNTHTGQTLRLKGQGRPGIHGSPAGDAFVEVTVKPHPYFEREDLNIYLDLPVTLQEAVMGASVQVPTIHGRVQLKVPPSSSGGTKLRLKGKGIRDAKAGIEGDQFVTLRIVLPDPPDRELTDFLARWQPKNTYNPRKIAGME